MGILANGISVIFVNSVHRRSYIADVFFFGVPGVVLAVLVGSPVPRSICLTSASFGGARMLGFLAGISSSSRLISVAIMAISFLPLAAYALAAI